MAATYTTAFSTTTKGSVATVTSTVVVVLPAPSGYPLDFDNPARKGDVTTAYWIFSIGSVLAFVFLVMRFYTKIGILRSFVVDDALIAMSYVFSLACQSLLVYLWKNELQGVHAWEIALDRYILFNLLLTCTAVLYALTQGLAKLSLLFFYRRLAPFPWFHMAVHSVIFCVIGYTIGITCSLLFACKPIASNWDVTIPGKCINKPALWISFTSINVATDIATLVLPMTVLVGLQIRRIEKIALVAVFAIGSVTCITSIIRLVLLIPLLSNPDQPWAISTPDIWILVEANLVVVCGCLPIARKFARHVAPKLFSYASSRGVSGGPSHIDSGYVKQNREGGYTLQTIGSKRSRPLHGSKKDACGVVGIDDSNVQLSSSWNRAGPEAIEESSARAWSDQGSETGIVQTKTTTIEYSEGSESIENEVVQPRGI